MSTPEDVAARLTALAEKATPGPWTYRPMQYDDWGMVRADDMAFVAGAHAGRHVSDAELDEHRRNKTDPFEHNGLFISACREGVPALCEALASQRATIERLERERDEAKAISQGWELQAGEAEAEVERLPEESTAEMKLAGARSIANSMHYENHGSRAELCWRHMVANFRTGAMPPVPKADPRSPASAKTAEDR